MYNTPPPETDAIRVGTRTTKNVVLERTFSENTDKDGNSFIQFKERVLQVI